MNLLEKIIFVADYIEPRRHHSDKLPAYRELAMTDLDKVTAHILKDSLEYLAEKESVQNVIIDPMTCETFEFYKKYL